MSSRKPVLLLALLLCQLRYLLRLLLLMLQAAPALQPRKLARRRLNLFKLLRLKLLLRLHRHGRSRRGSMH